MSSKYYETTEEEGGKFCLLEEGESEMASWEREHSRLEKSENHECVNKVILVVTLKKTRLVSFNKKELL